MQTTTAMKLANDDGSFSDWLKAVKAKFEQPEEFQLASEIFSFAAAYDDGATPEQAYTDFDEWASA